MSCPKGHNFDVEMKIKLYKGEENEFELLVRCVAGYFANSHNEAQKIIENYTNWSMPSIGVLTANRADLPATVKTVPPVLTGPDTRFSGSNIKLGPNSYVDKSEIVGPSELKDGIVLESKIIRSIIRGHCFRSTFIDSVVG
jgi:hypothetical protein